MGRKHLSIPFQSRPSRGSEVRLTGLLNVGTMEMNSYCYDAYLLRCSQKYNAPLITLDKKLLNTAKALSIEIITVE